jgi:feruloyl esterase
MIWWILLSSAAAVALPNASLAAPCTNAANLAGFSHHNTVIDSAEEATTPVPHCNIYGRINPDREGRGTDTKIYNIGFNVRLPDAWNHRFLQLGGGGTDGSIPTTDPFNPGAAGYNQLGEGYAITSNDGGHEDAAGPFGPNPTLIANPNLSNDQDDATGGTAHFGVDPQARVDYGYNAIQKSAMVAKALIRAYYQGPPQYSYFNGCSNGGREAFVASQRFPKLFDGIVAKSPGFDLPRAAVAEAWNQRALLPLTRSAADDPTTNPPAPYFGDTFSNSDLGLVGNAVNAACDALDGVADGMVNNFLACTDRRVHPELRKLQCVGGKTDTCLSRRQIKALTSIVGGPRNSGGQQLYAFDQVYASSGSSGPAIGPHYRAFPWDPGIAATSPGALGWQAWMMALIPQAAPVNTALNLTLGGGALPMIFVTPPVPLPTTPATGGDARAHYVLNFDFDADAPKIFATHGIYRQSSVEFMTGADVDLSAFELRGGKMIISHGGADGVFSLTDTTRWYNAMNERMGADAQSFVRLFAVPGMAHCGGGPATSSYDDFGAVVNWVENGQAPDTILATAPAGSPFAGRTRPLCPYPQYARYKGTGDVESSDSFECVQPRHFTGRELDGDE